MEDAATADARPHSCLRPVRSLPAVAVAMAARAVGVVEGDANCQVALEARNVKTGGVQFTQWTSGATTPLYHNDGVHQLAVWVDDRTSNKGGPGAWVN